MNNKRIGLPDVIALGGLFLPSVQEAVGRPATYEVAVLFLLVAIYMLLRRQTPNRTA